MTPPTRFRFFVCTLNGIISKNHGRMAEKSASESIYPTWQVSLPDRRGHDPALRNISFRFNCLVGEDSILPRGTISPAACIKAPSGARIKNVHAI